MKINPNTRNKMIDISFILEYGYCRDCQKWHSVYDDCINNNNKDNKDNDR